MPPNPPSKREASMQIPPLFQKNFEPPPKWNPKYATDILALA